MKTDFINSFNDDEKLRVVAGLDSLNELDTVIAKYAGIDLPDTSPEGMNDYIVSYACNLLNGVNAKYMNSVLRSIDVAKEKSGKNTDIGKKSYNLLGEIIFSVPGAKGEIVIPYMVENSELVPFDVIQVGDTRVPFSRTNMEKIVNGMIKQTKNPDPETAKGMGKFAPYVGTENQPLNPTSSRGFLGNILHIQDRYRTGSSAIGDHWVTAEEVLDMAEKVANLAPIDLEKLARESLDMEIEKKAEFTDDTNDMTEETMSKIARLPWKQATEVPHGSYVSIPVIKKRAGSTDESYMEKAIVLKEFADLGQKKISDGKTIILTKDGKITIISNGDKMACLVDDKQTFKYPRVNFDSLVRGDCFLAFRGNEVVYPFIVTDTMVFDLNKMMESTYMDGRSNTRKDGRQVLTEIKYSVRPLMPSEEAQFFSEGDDGFRAEGYYSGKILPLPGKNFDILSYKEFIDKKSQTTGISEIALGNLYSAYTSVTYADKKDIGVICTSPDAKAVCVTGIFRGYLEDPEELTRFIYNERLPEFTIGKTAAEKSVVEVSPAGEGFVNVKIKYAAVGNGVVNSSVKVFDHVEDYRARGILKALGFTKEEAGEIVFKAQRNMISVYAPDEEKAKGVIGGEDKNALLDRIKTMAGNIKNNMALRAMGRETASQVAGNMVTDIAGPYMNMPLGAMVTASEDYKGLAKTARLLSKEFEKNAVEKKSYGMQHLAADMLLCASVFEKVADGNVYDMREVSEFIDRMRPVLEKEASDLISLKYLENKDLNYIIHPAYIGEAMNMMDNLVQLV